MAMKRIALTTSSMLVFVLIFFASATAQVQTTEQTNTATQASPQQAGEMETLFSGPIRFGGYGGPMIKLSPVRGQLGTWVGGFGGVIINNSLFIGGGGIGLTSNILADQSVAPDQSLAVGYGGLMLEYTFNADRLLHFGANFFGGWGNAAYVYRGFDDFNRFNRGQGFTTPRSSFFVLEPGAFAEVNVARWLRINGGVSYRYVNGINNLQGLTSADLSNVAVNLMFKFGSF
jgi:hypothetical protein